MANKKEEFVKKFIDILEQEGDMFFSSGDVDQDYELIVSTIKVQGYWAGNAVRYMFDKKLRLESIQPRMFG